MSTVQMSVKGGGQMKRYLAAMQSAVGEASGVRVGFLEDATYPAGERESQALYVAQVAFWNEFGTKYSRARPFFRQMIGDELGEWGDRFGRYLRQSDFKSDVAFALMGTEMKDALTDAIARWPGDNAPSTIARKGFDHGLVEKGVMQRATDFEVLSGRE